VSELAQGPTQAALAARVAGALRTTRRGAGTRLRTLARASDGGFTVSQLRDAEAGRLDLTTVDPAALLRLYEVDPGLLDEARPSLTVDPEAGELRTTGLTRSFEPGDTDGLLVAYLLLVR
jgi:hypothetical protein